MENFGLEPVFIDSEKLKAARESGQSLTERVIEMPAPKWVGFEDQTYGFSSMYSLRCLESEAREWAEEFRQKLDAAFAG